jgi:glyoxylase-like metal-dependent hydrolase (beta-lactamase superfamily II)
MLDDGPALARPWRWPGGPAVQGLCTWVTALHSGARHHQQLQRFSRKPPMANAQESALTYVMGDTLPEPGRTLEVAPGVRWLRMGLPFALDHINLWLLRDVQNDVNGETRQGWTIVDCGICNDATKANWQHIFDHELQGLPVLRVIVTHMHPDHVGLADWLTKKWSTPQAECRLWMSATDWQASQVAVNAAVSFGGEKSAQFFALHGLSDPSSLDQVRARKNYFVGLVPSVPERYRRLMDGMCINIGGRSWQCIVGYGHAPEHIALYCAELNVLISGDMVLPRISTNVSVFDLEPEANPLPLYLQSIDKLRALPADTLVLPSHGKPFTGLHQRIQQLTDHHTERYADVLAACVDKPGSAADMLPVLFKRSLDLHQTTFAMGESVAHLHALAEAGKMRALRGADGVQRFITLPS